MNKHTVLAVDDETNNLIILESYLEDAGYDIITAESGEEAWHILEEKHEEIDIILLDRMMPKMSGMDLMEKIKANHEIQDIPVIMQTAAAEKQQIVEGINAGVFYYLTKPFEEETLIAIVNSAVQTHSHRLHLQKSLESQKNMMKIIKDCYVELSTIEEANNIAHLISGFYPQPGTVITGVSELLLNAVEHGNLGISYDEKSRLLSEDKWHHEVDHRQQLDEHNDKKVRVSFKHEENKLILNIKDEGEGFDWSKYLEICPERATDLHGRGIAMANMLSFDELQYIGNGNEVECVVFLDK